MAGTTNGLPATPLSPTSTTTSLFAANRRVQQLDERFGIFATQMNSEIQSITARLVSLEGTMRQREEEIKRAFDITAAQRAAELAEVVANAKTEFDTQRTNLQNMSRIIESELREVQQQVVEVKDEIPSMAKDSCH